VMPDHRGKGALDAAPAALTAFMGKQRVDIAFMTPGSMNSPVFTNPTKHAATAATELLSTHYGRIGFAPISGFSDSERFTVALVPDRAHGCWKNAGSTRKAGSAATAPSL
jgi:hypothetical protein